MIPLLGADGAMVTQDEGLRETTIESLGKLKPAFRTEEHGGRVTAGNSSQITDGAAAMLIMSEEKARQMKLTPRARFVNFSLAGDNPRMMLTAPIPATQKVLALTGLYAVVLERVFGLDPKGDVDAFQKAARDGNALPLALLYLGILYFFAVVLGRFQ